MGTTVERGELDLASSVDDMGDGVVDGFDLVMVGLLGVKGWTKPPGGRGWWPVPRIRAMDICIAGAGIVRHCGAVVPKHKNLLVQRGTVDGKWQCVPQRGLLKLLIHFIRSI